MNLIDETKIVWPSVIRAERALLGRLMEDPAMLDTLNLAPGAFRDTFHRALFLTLIEMRQDRKPIEPSTILIGDPDLLVAYLDADDRISACMAAAAVGDQIDLCIEQITASAIRRGRIDAAAHLLNAYQGAASEGEIVGIEAQMKRALDSETTRTSASRQQQHADFMDSYGRGTSRSVSTPLSDLNEKLGGGLPYGEHIVLGGRSGDGKTAFALYLLLHAAIQGEPVLYVSLEQRRYELRKRLISQLAGHERLWGHGLAHGRIAREDTDGVSLPVIQRLSARLSTLALWIEDGVFEADAILRVVRDHINRHKVKFVVLDYIQRVRDAGLSGDSAERLAIAGFSKRWYELTKTHDVTGILLSQDNREQEKGKTKRRPRLADLKGSGSLEEDADKVVFVYVEDPGYQWGEVIVAKDRSGDATGSIIRFTRDSELLTFRNHTAREDG